MRINEDTLPRLIKSLLGTCRDAAARGVAATELTATEAYVAGLCHALKLTTLRTDEADGKTYVMLLKDGLEASRNLDRGMSLDAALDMPRIVVWDRTNGS